MKGLDFRLSKEEAGAAKTAAGIIEQQAFMDEMATRIPVFYQDIQYMEGVRMPHPLCPGLFRYSQHKERKPERTKHRIL